jgi:16S rRNA (guanine1207-N2)-methyltransferase
MPQYFDAPEIPASPTLISATLRGHRLRLYTDHGVFSRCSLDRGTRVLLSVAASPPPDGDLLDLGCGYGPIAVSLALEAPRARVWAVDVNPRAIALCARNCEALGLANVRACTPEDVPERIRFAAIWSNPPIRIGKEAVHGVLTRWLRRLEPGCHATLVVQRHLGADSLQDWLTHSGWPTTRIASRGGYRVLDACVSSPVATADAPQPLLSRESDADNYRTMNGSGVQGTQ